MQFVFSGKYLLKNTKFYIQHDIKEMSTVLFHRYTTEYEFAKVFLN